MPTFEVQTAEGIRLRTELAGVGSRLGAALLDLILIVAGYLSLLLLLALLNLVLQETGVDLFGGASSFVMGLMVGGILLVLPGYFAVFHVLWNGQTPGKRMLNLRVVDAHGAGAAPAAHLLRSLLWLVEAVLWVPIPLGLALIIFTPRCRRLGDIVAGTLVLAETGPVGSGEPWPDKRWEELEPKQLDLSAGMAAKLGEEDLALMRDAIGRRDLPSATRQQLYREIVEHYAGQLGFTPHENPRVSLRELYLFGRDSRES